MFSRLYLKFFLLFLVFGFFIILAIYFVNKEVLKSNLDYEKATFAFSLYKLKSYNLEKTIEEAKVNINSLLADDALLDYLNKDNSDKIEKIFYDFVLAKSEIFQIRLLDIKGNERVRVHKYFKDEKPEIVPASELQNKANSDYFKNTINDKDEKIHVSEFNLNVEKGEIQKPYIPTIRLSRSIYKNGEKKGIIVFNINMNKFINSFKSFSNFDTYLIDKDGYFLIHEDKNKEWSNILNRKYSIKDEVSDIVLLSKIFNNEVNNSNFIYTFSLENILNNKQGLKLVFKPKESVVEVSIKLLSVVVPFIIILGLILAIYPTKIREKLLKTIEKNEKNLAIINQNVAMSIANENGKILEVNDAFCELTSYSRAELINNPHNLLKSGNTKVEVYENLWKTIRSGKVWIGELENLKKNGQTYWIDLRIEPRINEYTNNLEFVSIVRNITDKKLMEKLAQTDSLTNLYNRVRLDSELKKQLYNVQRYNTNVSIMLLDIDHFKKVNDTYGHNIGDSVLIEFANILKSSVRTSDIVGRWGGEEFIIISPETTKEDMFTLATKIKESIAKYNFTVVGNKTVSIGISQIKEIDGSEKDAVKRADEALYYAKSNGRNRVESEETILNKIIENNYII